MSRKLFLSITAVVAVLLLIFAIDDYDYYISSHAIDNFYYFREFFNVFGEMPANMGILVGTAILFFSRKERVNVFWKLRDFVVYVLMLLLCYFNMLMPIHYVYEFNEKGMPTSMNIVALVLGVILFAIIIFVGNKIGTEWFRNYKKHANFLLLFVISEIIIVNVLKVVWGRPRMRSLESADDFKRWYEISGPAASEEFKSFPSGHTANAFAMLGYSLFALGKRYHKFIVTFALIWGTCVAASRVIIGAHFLTDVMLGGYISILVFFVLTEIMFKKEAN